MPDASSILAQILRAQAAWAETRDLEVDAAGCLQRVEDNFLVPHRESLKALQLRAPREDESKPSALRALHSSAALVHNVVEYWRERDPAPLLEACGLAPGAATIHLARSLPVATDEGAAEVDVLIEPAEGPPVALVGSFLEPYECGPSRPGRDWLASPGCWGRLHGCSHLAADLRLGARRFQRLALARHLELALALTRAYGPRGFRLLHVWYASSSHAARRYRQELDRLRIRIGGEVDFQRRSWQEIFAALERNSAEHRPYTDYLASRYFGLHVPTAAARDPRPTTR